MSHTVWTQWRNLDGPPGFEMVHSEPPDDVEVIGEEVTVYVPRYLGETALEVIPSLPARRPTPSCAVVGRRHHPDVPLTATVNSLRGGQAAVCCHVSVSACGLNASLGM